MVSSRSTGLTRVKQDEDEDDHKRNSATGNSNGHGRNHNNNYSAGHSDRNFNSNNCNNVESKKNKFTKEEEEKKVAGTEPEVTTTIARFPITELRINDKVAKKFSNGGKIERQKKDERNDVFSMSESQSGPSSLLSSVTAHVDNHLTNLGFPDEESYEGFGFAETKNTAGGHERNNFEIEIEPEGGSFGCGVGGDDSSSSAPSPTGPNSLSLKSSSPCSTIGRHAWLRTSLRRTSPSTANRQRQLGSNALASQLYRSGSFNSSGRGSICDAVDDMYSDASLEDDVIDLNNRVRMIQEQMHVLTDTHSVGEERYARAKQENATLQARILILEEAAKDAETRAEEKLEIEERRHRERMCRLEREKQLQLENCAIKMQTIELECTSLREQIAGLRKQLDSSREERGHLDGIVQDLRREVSEAREAERQALLRCNEARVLLDAAREELSTRANVRQELDELENEIAQLRARNKSLEESRDELQAAAALHAGRELLMLNLPRTGYDTLDASDRDGPCSLAVELSTDALRDRNSINRIAKEPKTVPELGQALKEQQEVNTQLRSYIDGILLNIVDNYPQLLEVKQPNNGGS